MNKPAEPWAPDAWQKHDSVKIGYEISFNRYFYKPQPMRPLDEIRADIRAVEGDTAGLLAEIVRAPALTAAISAGHLGRRWGRNERSTCHDKDYYSYLTLKT